MVLKTCTFLLFTFFFSQSREVVHHARCTLSSGENLGGLPCFFEAKSFFFFFLAVGPLPRQSCSPDQGLPSSLQWRYPSPDNPAVQIKVFLLHCNGGTPPQTFLQSEELRLLLAKLRFLLGTLSSIYQRVGRLSGPQVPGQPGLDRLSGLQIPGQPELDHLSGL